MRAHQFIVETAATELAKRVGGLPDYKYATIDDLMTRISRKHDISPDDLHHQFVNRYKKTPDHWIKDQCCDDAARQLRKRLKGRKTNDKTTVHDLVKRIAHQHKISASSLNNTFKRHYGHLPHHLNEDVQRGDYGDQPLVKKFIAWTAGQLNLKHTPDFEFSYDTQEAQNGHHTGRHVSGSGVCWVYVGNRNMVDVFRTVAHEMVHVRQDELNMIKPGDSYPGSPIEMLADMVAGKLIKIFGKQHHEIFQ